MAKKPAKKAAKTAKPKAKVNTKAKVAAKAPVKIFAPFRYSHSKAGQATSDGITLHP